MNDHHFQKGDVVRFQRGLTSKQGIVREDRGPLGIKGRHLYVVEFELGSGTSDAYKSRVELPAEEMEFVEHAVSN